MPENDLAAARPRLMVSQPGVARDGTTLSTNTYIEAHWSRFQFGLPRKMAGYREKIRSTNGIVRTIDVFSNNAQTYVHLGSGNAIQRFQIDNITGANTQLIDRTPAGFAPDPKYGWQMAQVFNTADGTTQIAAALLPSAVSLSGSDMYPVYVGDILSEDILTPIPPGTSFTASITGTTMTVTALARGNLFVGQEVDGAAPGTVITAVTTPFSPGPPVVNGVYTVSVSQTVASTTFTADKVESSGGCCAIGGFLFLYGHDGYIQWPAPYTFDYEDVTNGAGDSRPVADKIVRGMPLRGQTGPAGIFWSLSSVILGTFTGGVNVWDFTTVTTTGSILSANAIVEHNGIYYWPTTSGWSMFNGVVRDLPNDENKQWFLDNLNLPERIKVYGYKVPRWDEIWWCFPKGSSTECNHAVILNYKTGRWFDTPLPNGGRSAAQYEFIYNFPLMTGVEYNDDAGGYSVWQHETGLDEVSGAQAVPKAIKSFYETEEYSLVEPQQPGQLGVDQCISYSVLEPDFEQVGDLSFSVISRANAQSKKYSTTGPLTVKENPGPGEQLVKFMHTGRLTRFRIESNVLGGNYLTGSPLLHFQVGDGRRED